MGDNRPARGGGAGAATPSPREQAVRILIAYLQTSAFPDRQLDAVHQGRAAVMEMVYGAIRRRRTLEWILARYADRRPPVVPRACALAGLYELFFMDGVAEYAAVNEAVAIAARRRGRGAAGFVNHVLRRACADRDALREALAAAPLGVRASHPDRLIARWTQAFGADAAAALCDWNNRRPDVTLRVNAALTSLPELRARLAAGGIEAAPHPFDPVRCLVLTGGGTPIARLPGFAEGAFVVQDPATLAAVDLLAPQPGDGVLDACAAPGGKALLIAARLRGRGRLVALDAHEDRLARLRENLSRLKVDADVIRGDATSASLAALNGGAAFDRILLDVPCSNTGVLCRRPDARWRFNARRFRQLVGLQRRMLENAARLVRPGGTIVYSTCSLEPEENQEQIAAFLAAHPDVALVGERRLFPPATGTDGAYAAALRPAG